MPELEFDAFFSYSHDDGAVARTLQRELERFGRRWYQARRLRIFRDDTAMSANPDLWRSIVEGMRRSRRLVLLASPAAAQSEWVDREIAWWLDHRPDELPLLVLTAATGDEGLPSVLPPRLARVMSGEPFWVDLRPDDRESTPSPDDARFRRAVENLAGPLNGLEKDEIVGEHLRERRRLRQLTGAAVTVLAFLTIVAVLFAIYALVQRDEAQEQARVALSRSMAQQAVATIPARLDTAQVLAAQAYRLDRNPETRAALLQTSTASPELTAILRFGRPVTSLGASVNGEAVAVGLENGRVTVVRTRDRAQRDLGQGSAPVISTAVDRSGGVVAAADGEIARVWTPRRPATSPMVVGGQVQAAALSDSGALVAALHGSSNTVATLHSTDDGRELRRFEARGTERVAVTDDGTVTAVGPVGKIVRVGPLDPVPFVVNDDILTPAGGFVPGASRDGRWFGFVKYGRVSTFDATPTAVPTEMIDRAWDAPQQLASRNPEAMTVADSGTSAVVADSGALHLTGLVPSPRPGRPSGPATAPPSIDDVRVLVGGGPVTAGGVVFLGARRLASASEERVVLWDLDAPSRLSTSPSSPLESGPNSGAGAAVALEPGGGRLAVVSPFGDQALVVGPQVAATALPVAVGSSNDIAPVWASDRHRVYLLGFGGTPSFVLDVADRVRVERALPPAGSELAISAAASPDGRRLVLVDFSGAVTALDADTLAPLRVHAAPPRVSAGAYGLSVGACVDAEAQRAAVIRDGRVEVVDVETGETHVVATDGAVQGVACAGDLFVATEAAVERWTPTGEDRLAVLPFPERYQAPVTVDPGAGLLARLRADGAVVLTDLAAGSRVGEISAPDPSGATTPNPYGAAQLVADPTNHVLFAAVPGGAVTSWSLREEDWLRAACATAGRGLTDADRTAFHLEDLVGPSAC
ncbi:toll/interleukin-1 receptor domain-containing protein [Actinomycetospora aeridis]|uniref:Toll/interleukin-1 receptor domain-containing protein n=1 Tax=Actinomycetospora aeridis TaxID=3129231 RepID=A0ABU8N669_9PSEU